MTILTQRFDDLIDELMYIDTLLGCSPILGIVLFLVYLWRLTHDQVVSAQSKLVIWLDGFHVKYREDTYDNSVLVSGACPTCSTLG